MTTFDTSTGGSAAGFNGSGPNGQVTAADIARIQAASAEGTDLTPAQQAEADNQGIVDPPLGSFGEGDTLSLLAARAQEVIEAGPKQHEIFGVARQFKIVCEARITEGQIRSWQRKSLPQAKRRASANNVSMFDMDQRRMALQCLHNTAVALYVRKGTERGVEVWAQVPITETNGSIFDDQGVKKAFKAIDQDTVINRIFGDSDGPMITAATEVMGAAGWGDAMGVDDDDDYDEYAELNPRTGR